MCKRCDNDIGAGRTNGGADDLRAVCRRMRSRTKQWWEREPGWFRRDFKSAPLPTTSWPKPGTEFQSGGQGGVVRSDPRRVPCVATMNQRQLMAELKRQSRRLAGRAKWEEE